MSETTNPPGDDRQRYRTLLEINNAVVSNLTREALFHAIAEALRPLIPFDRAAVFLHDPRRDVLTLFILETSLPSDYFVVGLEMPATDSHVGRVFRERQPLRRRDLAVERQYPMEEKAWRDGVRSYVIVPLIAHGRCLGTLAVASTRPDRYSEADVTLLQEAAGQVALAVENMATHEELAALARENARLYDDMRREAERRRRSEHLLRTITEGTSAVTGADFFRSLVRHVAHALEVRHAFVTECLDEEGRRVRTLAFWQGERFASDVEYDVAPTPCARVLAGEVCHYPHGVQERFPEDRDLVALGAASYLGIPICGGSGRVIGHLAVLDAQPLEDTSQAVPLLRIFAARAGAEIERLRAETGLKQALAEVAALKNRLHAENVYLQEEISREHNFAEIVGTSPALLAMLHRVEQVAPTTSTVLIVGETGTGKELVARAIHDRSPRRDRPLVKVNCAAISAGLVESELFGHVRGAFTGAIERRVGRFELANGGTIFLDEVGELPLDTQVKILRVLQEQEFEPVGSSRTVRVDVRVIAATNRDLAEAVRGSRFRQDLFYRLNVFPLAVPPLRERRDDIPQLALFFLSRAAAKFGKTLEGIAPASMQRLMVYPWPGNVRELQSVIDRAAILAHGPVLALDDTLLPVPTADGVASPGGQDGNPPRVDQLHGERVASLEEAERGHILAVLQQTGWRVEGPRGAARLLGLHPNTLRSRMERLGIKRPTRGIS